MNFFKTCNLDHLRWGIDSKSEAQLLAESDSN